MDNLLFKTHLNYQIELSNDKSETDTDTQSLSTIDFRKCDFCSFKKAMLYSLNNNAEYSFREASIDVIKPTDYKEGTTCDFIALTDYAKHTAITIGNMALFSDLQKISSAIENFTYDSIPEESPVSNTPVLPFQDYDTYTITAQPVMAEELGSCVIGGGDTDPLKITATFHDSSTQIQPIISVRAFSLSTNTYLTNVDIVNLDNIYKPNATLMETFAYMSYNDYLRNTFNTSFDKLLFSGTINIDSLDDMYEKHYDLSVYDHLNG